MTKSGKVLVVDASRVVRASLARSLRTTYEVYEESNAESAWQSLVLDSSIVAVVSGVPITTLDGAGLIERIRGSKLSRLNQMPFFLLVSESVPETLRVYAVDIGVSGFVPKESPGLVVDLLASNVKQNALDYAGQSDVGISDFSSRIGQLAGLADGAANDDLGAAQRLDDEYERRLAANRAEQCLREKLAAAREGQPAGVLLFGLDGYDELLTRFGRELAEKVVKKFSGLLAGKIRGEETLIQLADGRIGIVSPTAGRDQCASFAWRVCKALASAHISLRGQRIQTTVSAGVAAVPEDGDEVSAADLLRLASSRLDAAMRAGGNQVVFGKGDGKNSLNQEEFFSRLKDLLASASPDLKLSCTGWLATVCGACRSQGDASGMSHCMTSGDFCETRRSASA
jgi:two-component system cell cycle response regulator